MSDKFEKLFTIFELENKEIINEIHIQYNEDKKKAKLFFIKFAIIPITIIIIMYFKISEIQNVENYYSFASFTTFFRIVCIIVILGFFIILPMGIIAYNMMAKNHSRYNRKIKNNIIFNLINRFFENTDYIPKKGIAQYIYDEAEFHNYNKYFSDDYVEGILNQKYKFKMANVKTILETQDNNITTTFSGIFVKIQLKNSINNIIKISNYKGNDERKIETDLLKFDEIFDVVSNDKIQVMQLLTIDVMEELIKFSRLINCKFDISIINKAVYIRINNGMNFTSIISKKELINKEQIREFYNIFEFINKLSSYITNSIEESYISE